ncbi:MAG: TetR/AcrR family transcriptional regulator [Planctomycetes bacterium]|nr:TetR/AcrR family transcriptional regulator [Planctomycetota bacterium]
MARPNRSDERRSELLPVVAAAFAELGYRRATTSQLAERCGVQETILYRLWPDKRSMFTAAIEFVAEHSRAVWAGELATAGAGSTAEAVLDYESEHLGEHGLYRLLFAGLSEADDPEIRRALRSAYRTFHRFILSLVEGHQGREGAGRVAPEPVLAAWALIGLGTMASVGRELDLISGKERRRLLASIGRHLLGP